MIKVFVLMQNDMPIGVIGSEKEARKACNRFSRDFAKKNPEHRGPAYFYFRGPFVLPDDQEGESNAPTS